MFLEKHVVFGRTVLGTIGHCWALHSSDWEALGDALYPSVFAFMSSIV